MELSAYTLELLRKDPELVLYRGHSNDANPSSILLLTTLSKVPTPEALKRIDREYSLTSDLDTTWAARPAALSEYNDRAALILEDPGGEPLSRLIRGPTEMKRFLRLAVGVTTALRQVAQSTSDPQRPETLEYPG